jgi:hypothetical protein
MKLNYKTPLLLLLLVASVSYLYKSYLNDKKTIKIQPSIETTILLIDKNSSKSPTPKVSEPINAKVNYLGVGSSWHNR